MAEWQQVKLGDVAESITVGHVGSMASQYEPAGVPFLRSQNVLPHRLDLSEVKYIGQEFHMRLRKSALRSGDVVTVRTGKPGATAVVPDGLPELNCSDLVITRPGKLIDPRWLSYYINSAAAGFISSQLVGAVQQHFNVGSAREMTLVLPALPEQRAIAEVLGALDDKIAANVNLATTAAEFATLSLAGMPVSVALSAVVTHHKKVIDPDKFGSGEILHYSLPAFDAGYRPVAEGAASIKSAKFLIETPCVLLSKLNPRFPRAWDVRTVLDRPMLASTEFLVLESRYSTSSVLWAILSQAAFTAALEAKVAGTSGSHQRVNPADLLATHVIDPRTLDESLRDLITALGERIGSCREESASLMAMRDALLPELMSGRIRVKDAERRIGEAL